MFPNPVFGHTDIKFVATPHKQNTVQSCPNIKRDNILLSINSKHGFNQYKIKAKINFPL